MRDMPWIGRATPRDLTDADFAAAAARLRCEPAALRAVWEVEASGRCFDAMGRVLMRFEPHQFPRQHWTALGFAPGTTPPWRASLRLSEAERWRMFTAATRIDMEAALAATSHGGPQIMGFNAPAAGYASALDMVRAMAEGAPVHLIDAFVSLILAWRLDGALRALDWLAFARRYNGTGQPEVYAARMESAYRRHAGRASPAVLRVGDRGEAVTALQRALTLHGFEVPDDGAFGPGTLAAVEAFQAAHGLPVDGIVGARTWGALRVTPPEVADPPPPVAQDTVAAQRVDRIGQIATLAAPVATAVPVIGAVQDSVDPLLWQVVTWGAVALVVLALAPWVMRRLRGAVR